MNKNKYLVLTGPPGVGKTTVVKKIYSLLADKNVTCKGFYTEEMRDGRERTGFQIVDFHSGNRSPLASTTIAMFRSDKKVPTVGKYSVDVASFEKTAVPILTLDGVGKQGTVLLVDEVGKMELLSKTFERKLQDITQASDVTLLATIPSQRDHEKPIISFLRNSSTVFQVTRENRETLPQEISRQILEHLKN